nr:hypothetical protein [Vibrio sinus]
MFVLPVIVAKLILSNNWYQSGVTNNGELFEPSVSFKSLGLQNPLQSQTWQLGFVVPEKCDRFCGQQLYLLGQSYTALGKYQARVTPVVFLSPTSDVSVKKDYPFKFIDVSNAFTSQVHDSEYVIVDPLGQLVMRYPKPDNANMLVSQSKGLLADLKKLLKLSRVG